MIGRLYGPGCAPGVCPAGRGGERRDAAQAEGREDPGDGAGASGSAQESERKEAELVQVLRKRDGIAIEKSADQMDEIQSATERDMAIRNVDRESSLLRGEATPKPVFRGGGQRHRGALSVSGHRSLRD